MNVLDFLFRCRARRPLTKQEVLAKVEARQCVRSWWHVFGKQRHFYRREAK